MPESQNETPESPARPRQRRYRLLPLLVTVLLAQMLAWWWLRTGVCEKTGMGPLFWMVVLAISGAAVFLSMAGWRKC